MSAVSFACEPAGRCTNVRTTGVQINDSFLQPRAAVPS